jgi:hypothetical protein
MGCMGERKDNAMSALNAGKSRKCTDVLCLLFFGCFWFGMVYIVAVGFTMGDPDRLIFALDYKFDQCNKDNSAEARGLASLEQNISSTDGSFSRTIKLGGRNHQISPHYYMIGSGPPRFRSSYVGVCFDECPGSNAAGIGYKPEDWVCTGRYYGTANKPDLNIEGVPRLSELSQIAVEHFVEDVRAFSEGVTDDLREQARYLSSFFLIRGGSSCEDDAENDEPDCTVCYPSYPTISYEPAFCVPNATFVRENAAQVSAVFGEAFSLSGIKDATDELIGRGGSAAMTIANDAYASYPIIFGCIGFSLLLAFLWAFLMRLFIKPMVWVTLVGTFLLLVLFTYLLGEKALEMRADALYGEDNTFTRYADATLGFFAFAGGLFVAYTVVVGCFWRRIWMVCGVIIEASKALARMPTLLVVPLVPALLAFGLFTYLLLGSFYILSAGELKLDGSGFAQIDFDDDLRGTLAYHFFGVVWTVVWLNHVAWVVVAMAVTQWYFARDKATDLGPAPVASAAGRVVRYHLGSIVFGSLVVAVVKYLRYIVYFVKSRAQPDNKCWGCVVKYSFCCVECCLRCFEKLLDFISKNGYVLICVQGDSFCGSCRAAFGYIASNLGGIALLNAVGDLFLFIGKMFVALVASGACALILLYVPSYRLATASIILPCALVFLGAYLIASIFMGVYEMTIDSLFVCFLIDEDKQLGYADGALRDFVKASGKDTSSTREAPAGDTSASRGLGPAPTDESQLDA